MLTFSLDEFGDFEGLKGTNEPVYIAGLIFDDHLVEREEWLERKRIRAYYEAVISEVAGTSWDPSLFSYPESLHSNGERSRDHDVVRPVKQRINETLAEFIKDGTYNGRELQGVNSSGGVRNFPARQGEYHVFVVLKSDRGMTRLLSRNANILSKDDYASNLYFHMVSEVISRLIFYNPVISDVDDISLDIATRTSADLEAGSPLAAQYKQLGYKENICDEDDPDSKVYFSLTNPDIYRSIIAEEILDAEKPGVKVSKFNVVSINYHSRSGMEFLFMADSICSILGYEIEGDNADEWLNCIVKRTYEITGRSDSLVFGYDEIDNIFSKAWYKYTEGDYYKALSLAHDAGKQEGAFADHYRNVWFKKLEERISEKKNVSAFNMAIRKLHETLDNNSLDQEKCLYILDILERILPATVARFNTPEAKRVLYFLYDTGVTAYCHIGDSKKAEEYFHKCSELAGLVSLEDYLNTRNKYVVFCCDYFEMDRAEELANENVLYQEQLMKFTEGLNFPGVSNQGIISLAKARSQLGQVYAFKRLMEAEKEFRMSMRDFGRDTANYKITQSYLMHFYIDMGMKEGYLKEAEEYFGGQYKLRDQLKYIIGEGSKNDAFINVKFALYVYVRALYKFRLNEMTDGVWSDLKTMEKDFGEKIKKNWKLTGHPSELIFKYLSLIAMSRGDDESERLYSERMESCLSYRGATIDAIQYFSEAELAGQKGDTRQRDRLILALYRYMAENFEVFKSAEIPEDDLEGIYNQLCERMTFMYR